MSTDKSTQSNISVRLREALERKGVNIKEASAICGIPYRSFQNYTLGLREPSADALTVLSVRLGISADWLLTGEGSVQRSDTGDERVSESLDTREQALLALWRDLDEDAQREIQRAAEEKKRLTTLEQRVSELEAVVSDIKRLA